MSVYTESDFAAALLNCGPHKWHTCETGCSINASHPINQDYRDRVYKYFLTLFPSTLLGDMPGHEWTVFWRQYLEWVNKS